jgi:hypothetical protein
MKKLEFTNKAIEDVKKLSESLGTWPASVDWAGATAPTLTAAGVDTLEFITSDGGTIWSGNIKIEKN